jgi:hypothetical protein
MKIIILIFALFFLTGCRYRLHGDGIQLENEMLDEVYETEEIPVPEPSVEAEPDIFSPFTAEIHMEDAPLYATTEAVDEVVMEIPSETAPEEQTVVGDDGGLIGIIADNTTLLRTATNTLFPCQQLYIYTEMPQEFLTIARNSDVYQLMLNAGGLNVSSRLNPDNLVVSADWVVRRNPDIIVKFTENYAHYFSSTLAAREGWHTIEAVRNDRILIFPVNMLDYEETRLALKLLISRAMYPELFENIDVDSAVAELIAS